MKKWMLFAISVWLLVPAIALADDLLYATDGTALYTVDLQTGALTFQTNGPLGQQRGQWVGSRYNLIPWHSTRCRK
jgi:hypothetical protein